MTRSRTFWNAPIAQPDHAERACRAALRIVENLRELNLEWEREGGLPRLDAGVGLNTGACTVGNFGSTHRFDYSVIGDAVNVAARLESETRKQGFHILLGAETAARVAGFATLPLGPIHVKGRQEALDVHALIGDESVRPGSSFRELHARHMAERFGAPERESRRA